MSRLSKVTVLHTYRQADRQTGRKTYRQMPPKLLARRLTGDGDNKRANVNDIGAEN